MKTEDGENILARMGANPERLADVLAVGCIHRRGGQEPLTAE